MNNPTKMFAILGALLFSDCQGSTENIVTKEEALTTVKTSIITNGVLVNNWKVYCCGTKAANSTEYPFNNEPTYLKQFLGHQYFNLTAPNSGVAITNNDYLSFDIYGGTENVPTLDVKISSSTVSVNSYCTPAIAPNAWSHCTIPMSNFGEAQTISGISFINPNSVPLSNIAFTNLNIITTDQPNGTGGASSVGGSSNVGGVPSTGGIQGTIGGSTAASSVTNTGGTSVNSTTTTTGGNTWTSSTAAGGNTTVSSTTSTGGITSTGGATSTTTTPVGGSSSTYMSKVVIPASNVYVNVGDSSNQLVDDIYSMYNGWNFSNCSTSQPCRAAFNVGNVSNKVLVQWSYESGVGIFAGPTITDYTIEVSNNSTNGTDGTWTNVVSVSSNQYIYREHSFDFIGNTWVRMSITSSNISRINEFSIYDASASNRDMIFFHGDSITATCSGNYDGGTTLGQMLNTLNPGYHPITIDGGTIGKGCDFAESSIDTYLATFPDANIWVYVMGTNDLNWTPTSWYKNKLQLWVNKVKAAGKTPIISHVIWANTRSVNEAAFNVIVDQVVQENNLTPAIPLYEATVNHSEYFRTGDVHPNYNGCEVGWRPVFANYFHQYL